MITDLFQTPAQRRQVEEFADLLEGRLAASGDELESLVTLAGSMRTPAIAPSRDFSAALRARLVQETSQRSTAARVPVQRTVEAQQSRSHRIRQAVAAMTAVAIVGGAGTAAASTRALPGDSLYGLKRGLEAAQLSLAGSEMARGRELLEQADARLGEAETMAESEDAADAENRSRIGQVLSDMDAAVRDGSTLLTEVYRQTGDTAALELLDRFVIDQQRRLDALIDRLAAIDPALADEAEATSDLLASLHAQVIAVIGVQAVSSAAGAARDPRASGDGWEVSRAASGDPSAGLVEDVAEAGTGATSIVGTPDTTTLDTGATTLSGPTVVSAPPVTTAPTQPLPQLEVESPCVPVPPLTTC